MAKGTLQTRFFPQNKDPTRVRRSDHTQNDVDLPSAVLRLLDTSRGYELQRDRGCRVFGRRSTDPPMNEAAENSLTYTNSMRPPRTPLGSPLASRQQCPAFPISPTISRPTASPMSHQLLRDAYSSAPVTPMNTVSPTAGMTNPEESRKLERMRQVVLMSQYLKDGKCEQQVSMSADRRRV